MAPQLRDYAYYKTTQGMCATCRQLVNARIVERDASIFQQNLCPTCGTTETMIAEDRNWYYGRVNHELRGEPPARSHTRVERGCPHDCGLCSWHQGRANLPVFSITNACNLDCPICFTYNRSDSHYFMSLEEMARTVAFLLADGSSYDLINITGGEPTLHPQLLELLKLARHERIGRITMNSNGLRLAADEELVKQLAELGVYVILSFDTLDPETSRQIHGADIVATKLKALELLARHGVGVTLLNVMIGGLNDHEIAAIIGLSRRYANIRSVTVQTMTFTGQGGTRFTPHQRVTLDMAARRIEETCAAELRREHFFPLPANHPLCYNIGYFFKTPDGLKSFTDIFSVEALQELLGSRHLMHPDQRFYELFQQAITDSWSAGVNAELLAFLRTLLKRMYPAGTPLTPFERQRIAEESILTIYLHAHMDEENFDVSRIVTCTDLVPVDGERLIPACAYNLFYRMKDERFWYGADKEQS